MLGSFQGEPRSPILRSDEQGVKICILDIDLLSKVVKKALNISAYATLLIKKAMYGIFLQNRKQILTSIVTNYAAR